MPLMSGRIVSNFARPALVWAVGSVTNSGVTRPIVFHKPRGGVWAVKYLGAEIIGGTLEFLGGVRNPGDPAGTISVRVSNQDPLLGNNPEAAISTDLGATWSYIGVGDGTYFSTNDTENQLLNATDANRHHWQKTVLFQGLCSPAPGIIAAFAKSWGGVGYAQSDSGGTRTFDYYALNFGLAVSTDGGPFTFVGGPAEIATGFSSSSGIENPPPINKLLTPFSGAWRFSPRAIAPSRPNQPPSLPTSQYVDVTDPYPGTAFPYALEVLSGPTWSRAAAPIDNPETAFWDGESYVLGGRTDALVQGLYKASTFGAWSLVYSGGGGALGPSASRKKNSWVVGGKGITDDAGAHWRSPGIIPKAIQFTGTKYYALTGSATVQSSTTGDDWTVETLPTVTGSVVLNDIFGE